MFLTCSIVYQKLINFLNSLEQNFLYRDKNEENLFDYVMYSGKLGIRCVYSAQGTSGCNCGGENNALSLFNGLNSKLNLNILI